MLRRSACRLVGVAPADGFTQSDQVLARRLHQRYVHQPWSLRAMTGTRLQGFAAAAGIMVGTAFFLGPWLWDEWQELLHKSFVPLDPSTMPRTSPNWWENEWRKMMTTWRAGESTLDFYVKPYQFVREQTGRDLSSAARLAATRHTSAESKHQGSNSDNTGGSWLFWRRSKTSSDSSNHTNSDANTPAAASALVPLCGDSPIIRTMAIQGYDVDAVDCSQTAIQSAVEKTERALPLEAYPRIHLIWKDFFAPELWERELKDKQYDVIYERQAMTSLNRDQRPDYVYLLKRALKEDGILYVEGIFRTGRVKGNKIRGPPYSLSKKELEHLFPQRDGYFVRCEEKNDAMAQLSRENRVLQRVPRELYVTPFNCVVFRAAAVNLPEREKFVSELRASEQAAAAAAAAAPAVATA